MTFRFTISSRVLPLFSALALLLGTATPAHAADEDSNAPATADDAAPDEAPAPKPSAPAEKPPAPAAVPVEAAPVAEAPAVGLVERLPPSAYAAPTLRGLHGGSLWLSSQGAQWPYLPRTTIGVSGYVWLDTNYRQLTDGNPTGKNRKDITEQGRLVLRVTPTYSKGEWFAQGQAELVANKDQTVPPVNADVDDLWIRVGKWQAFDLTVGRFEAFEVYHLGMGLDINTDERNGAVSGSARPPQLYGASFLYYRPDGPADVALHAYPTKYLRFELLNQVGNSGGLNALGVRPAGILDLGVFKLKAAGEYQQLTSPEAGNKTKINNRGFAGSAQVVLDPYLEFGANAGYALTDVYDNVGNLSTDKSTTTTSFGGFMNVRIVPDLLVGGGVNNVKVSDQHYDVTTRRYGEFSNLQTFGALQYFWESTLMVKLVVGYAKADFDPTFATTPAFSNKLVSARLRMQLLF